MTKQAEPTMESVLRDLVRVAGRHGWRVSVAVLDADKREVLRVEMPPAPRQHRMR